MLRQEDDGPEQPRQQRGGNAVGAGHCRNPPGLCHAFEDPGGVGVGSCSFPEPLDQKKAPDQENGCKAAGNRKPQDLRCGKQGTDRFRAFRKLHQDLHRGSRKRRRGRDSRKMGKRFSGRLQPGSRKNQKKSRYKPSIQPDRWREPFLHPSFKEPPQAVNDPCHQSKDGERTEKSCHICLLCKKGRVRGIGQVRKRRCFEPCPD